MPATNDDVRHQQQQPPLPPMFQRLLDIHCHLTNQPYLPADHNSPSIPLPSCVAVHVEPKRFNRSRTQNFYILDSPSRRLQLPTIHLIGSTGNLYTLSFTLSGVCCNCPDTTPFCKHVLFILSVSGMMISKTTFYLNMEFTINQLRTVDLSNYMVDATTNSICCSSINLPCTICRKSMHREFLICSKCYGVSHKSCADRQIRTSQHRRRGDINGSLRHGTPTLCFLCNRPWMPFTVGCSGKYRNLSTVLKHFRYPLAVTTAPAGPIRYIHSNCKNNNDNNDTVHQFRSSSTLNDSNPFHPMNDLLHSAKRKLTYPSPEHGDSPSPRTALTVTRSPACPSSADLDDHPTGKRKRFEFI